VLPGARCASYTGRSSESFGAEAEHVCCGQRLGEPQLPASELDRSVYPWRNTERGGEIGLGYVGRTSYRSKRVANGLACELAWTVIKHLSIP